MNRSETKGNGAAQPSTTAGPLTTVKGPHEALNKVEVDDDDNPH